MGRPRKVKGGRTEQFSIKLSVQEKAFIKSFVEKFNKKHKSNFSQADLMIQFFKKRAKVEKFIFEHPQNDLFEGKVHQKGHPLELFDNEGKAIRY